MKHTPGPWGIQQAFASGSWDILGPIQPKAEESLIATVWDPLEGEPEEGFLQAKADAKLIAAAPQMLEALRCVAGEGLLVLSPQVEVTWLKVLDAIKAATGEDS